MADVQDMLRARALLARENYVNDIEGMIFQGRQEAANKQAKMLGMKMNPLSLQIILSQNRDEYMFSALKAPPFQGTVWHNLAFSRAINTAANGSGSHRGIYGF